MGDLANAIMAVAIGMEALKEAKQYLEDLKQRKFMKKKLFLRVSPLFESTMEDLKESIEILERFLSEEEYPCEQFQKDFIDVTARTYSHFERLIKEAVSIYDSNPEAFRKAIDDDTITIMMEKISEVYKEADGKAGIGDVLVAIWPMVEEIGSPKTDEESILVFKKVFSLSGEKRACLEEKVPELEDSYISKEGKKIIEYLKKEHALKGGLPNVKT